MPLKYILEENVSVLISYCANYQPNRMEALAWIKEIS